MKCEEVERRMIEEGTEFPEIEAHLAGCVACREFEATLRGLERHLAPERIPDPGPLYWRHFPGRVRARILEGEGERAFVRRLFALPWFVQVAPLFLLLLLLLVPRGGEGPRHSPIDLSEAEIAGMLELLEEESEPTLFAVIDLEGIEAAPLLAAGSEQGGEEEGFDDLFGGGILESLDELDGEELETLASLLQRS